MLIKINFFRKLYSVLLLFFIILCFSLGAKVNDTVPWVLDVILNKHIISPNPHVRQAACIWLLSLVRKLSTHKEVKVSCPIHEISSTGTCL